MKYVLSLLFGFLLPLSVLTSENLEWEPVTQDDWAITENASKGIHEAVMIFEKIEADDKNLIKGKCYYTIYRRIRILNAEGRKWGDVIIPVFLKEQKVEEIRGRTVLPDGNEISLLESHIIEKEIFKTKGIKIKQKSFSLPAVSDDCIVEYYIRYRMPHPSGLWLIQKDIHLLRGEYVWKFYSGKGLGAVQYNAVRDIVTPNYLWLNTEGQIHAEQRPSIKKPEEVFFTIQDVAAFEPEPYASPDIALRALVRCYYGGRESAAVFWGDRNRSICDELEAFTKKNKRVREVTAQFDRLTSDEEKISAAYAWLQTHILNTTYDESDEKDITNKNLDDILKHGCGAEEEINRVFYDMLREMNIDAKMAYVIDRDDNFFEYQVKNWQFDRSLVSVPTTNREYTFYNPGCKYLPPGVVAWFNEGTSAFVIGDMSDQFYPIPFSSAATNKINRYQELTLDEESLLMGIIVEKNKGHFARDLRVQLSQSSEKDRIEYVKNEISDLFSNSELDSFRVDGLEDIHKEVTVTCSIMTTSAGQRMGDRLLLKPYDLFSKCENPFLSDERKHPIMFDYAKEIVEVLQIDLSEYWSVEALPSDSLYSNVIGHCQIAFKSFNDGNVLSIQRLFRLNKPVWKVTGYQLVKKLFQAQQAFEEMTVVLTSKD